MRVQPDEEATEDRRDIFDSVGIEKLALAEARGLAPEVAFASRI